MITLKDMIANYLKKRNLYFFACLIGLLVGAVCGAFSIFLTSLTSYRKTLGLYPFLLLPWVGYMSSWLYLKFGKDEDRGNELILDEMKNSAKKIRIRLVPMIFFSTLASHFSGASVGREGVGVQIGAGIADQFSNKYIKRNEILMLGISAGFGAIFGAPISGAIFGIEVLFIGHLYIANFLPCLLSSIVASSIVKMLGVNAGFHLNLQSITISFTGLILSGFLGIYFGTIARFFVAIIALAKNLFAYLFKNKKWRAFLGGCILFCLFISLGSDRYFGISEELLSEAFGEFIFKFEFLAKILTTAISLGAGFKGGEVMPMFIVGASSGNLISQVVPLAKSLVVALGFVSVFAGAANVPIACVALSLEFFGLGILPYAIVCIFFSFLFSGNRGMYSSQRKKMKKYYFRKFYRKIFN